MSLCKKIIHALCLLIAMNSAVVVAQTCQTATIAATSPSNRFTVSNNGTVTDSKTGLMWKRCSEGLSGAGCNVGSAASYEWKHALQQAQTVNNMGGMQAIAIGAYLMLRNYARLPSDNVTVPQST